MRNKSHGLDPDRRASEDKLHIASSIAYPHEIMTVVLVTVIHVVKLKQHCRLSIIVGWNEGKEYEYICNEQQSKTRFSLG